MEMRLSDTSGFTLGLEQNEDVILLDGTLDVADNGTAAVIEELNLDLGDTTTRSGDAEDLGTLGELDGRSDIGLWCKEIRAISQHQISLVHNNTKA